MMRYHYLKRISFILCFCFWGCNGGDRDGIDNGFTKTKNITAAALQEGKNLAQTRCRSCHAYPEPDLLDKESWERYVLPTMGYRMGLYHRLAQKSSGIRSALIETGLAGELVLKANIFPEKPTISVTDFQKITDYYLTAAPAIALPPAANAQILQGLNLFKAHFPELPFRPASVTLVKIDSVRKQLLVGLANQKLLLRLNKHGQLLNSIPQHTAVSDYLGRNEGNYGLQIGSFFPSDAPAGNLVLYGSIDQKPEVVLSRLQRPVQVQFADLNKDNISDLLICEFGNQTGSLTWYEGLADKAFNKQVINNAPGAVRAYIHDLNKDNLPDVIALMAQGNEGIFIYYNLGKGRFREEQVLQFSPAMGSSYFEMVDFNQDGHLDILYTAGDNADFKPIQKRYHGIRIYLNNGRNKFKQTFFFPQNGAYKATAADFDNDGDLDIAAIAFFARFREKPDESFLYLENKGGFNFKASTFRGSNRGRWLTLDKGDLDNDGDIDLVLGSFILPTKLATEAQNQEWVTKGPVVVILENKIR